MAAKEEPQRGDKTVVVLIIVFIIDIFINVTLALIIVNIIIIVNIMIMINGGLLAEVQHDNDESVDGVNGDADDDG